MDYEDIDTLHAKILIIEDNLSHIRIYERIFEPFSGRINLKNVSNLEEAHKYLSMETPDIILLDLFLENDHGEDFITESGITEKYPVVVMTSFGSEELAVKAIKSGAMDYLVKSNENFKRLPHMVRRTLREWENIRKRQMAEKALKESEAFYRSLLEWADDFIFVLDRNGVIQTINKKLADFDGFPFKVGVNLKSAHEAQGADIIQEKIDQVFQTRQTVTFEYPMPINGKTYFFITNLCPIFDEDGEVTYISGMTRNITIQHETEIALRKSEQRFQTIADFTYDWEYWRDETGRMVYVSPSCERISGYKKEDFYENPGLIEKIIHPENKDAFTQHLSEETEDNSATTIEFRIIRSDGKECWIEHNCQPVFDSLGCYKGRRVSNRNITQRKEADQRIIESEQRFRLLSEATFEGIIFVNNAGTIIDLNQQICELLGYERGELNGKKLVDFIAEDYRAVVAKRIQEKIELDDVLGYLNHKQGDQLTFSVRTRINEINGEEVRVVILRNLTENLKTQEALETSERRFKAFMKNLPASVFYKNSNFEYQYVNPLCEKINGFPKGEWKGKTAEELFSKERADRYSQNDDQVLKTGEIFINHDSVRYLHNEKTYWENLLFRFEDVRGNQFLGGIGINTTERVLAEKALRASEERLRILSESTFEGIIFTENGIITDANKQFADIFGFSRDEVLGKQVLDFIYPEDEALLAPGLTGNSENKLKELRGIHKDGREVFLNISNRFAEIQGKDIWVMIFRDISEQKLTEKALLSSELRFKAFVENIPATILHKDSDGKYIYVNSHFLRDMDLEKESDWKNKSDFELYPQSLAERFRSNDLIILKNGIPMVNEEVLQLKGKELFRENIKFRFSDAEGTHFIGMIGIDTQERQKTQRALVESELRYKELFNNSKSAISVYEALKDGKGFVFKDYNRTAERLNNITKEQVIGKKVDEVFPELKESGYLSAVVQVWKSGTPLEISRKYYNSDKTAGWRNNYIYRLPSGEIVVIYEDVTEQVLAEEEKERQKKELERTNQLINYLNRIVTRIESILEPGEIITVLHEEFTNLGLDHFIAPFTKNAIYIDFIEHSIKSEAVSNLIPILNQAILQIKKSPDQFPLIQKIMKKRQVVYSSRVIPALLDAAVSVLEKESLMDIHSEFNQVKAILVERLMFLMPLFGEDEFFGLIGIGGKYLKTSDLAIFSNFTNQVSLSISKTQLLEKVKEGRTRLQALSNRLIEVQEDERKFLAQELHDEVGQTLTGLKLTLQTKQEGQQDLALRLIDELSEKVENLSLDLRPSILDDLGLQPALLWLMERFSQVTKVEVKFIHSGISDRRFQAEIETTVYRIIQEALTNVARHSGVSKAFVNLLADTQKINFEVRDNGKGIDLNAEHHRRSGGLLGMRERAENLMGNLSIVSSPGEGTLISAEIPLTKTSIDRRTKER